MKINEIITESANRNLPLTLLETVDGKNLHLEHLDDEIWNRGYQGAVEALQYLEGAAGLLVGQSDGRYFITKKWDGSPALFVGTDPSTGEFVMGDKGIFSGKKFNKITEPSDVNRVKPDVVKKGKKLDYSNLRSKLKIAFNYLKELNYGDRILQGDLLWTIDDGTSGWQVINGETYWTFKPNLLTYAVPAGPLANRMSRAKVGIAFHTTYEGGPTLKDMTARFGADVDNLGTSKDVYYRDAYIKDVSGSVTMTARESQYIEQQIANLYNILYGIGEDTFNWLNTTTAGYELRDLIKIDINAMIKAGKLDQPAQYVNRFIERLQTRLTADVEKLKTQKGQERKLAAQKEALDFIKNNKSNIRNVYMLFLLIQKVKDRLRTHYATIRQIDTFIARPDGSFDVKPEEGIVIVDHLGKGGKEAVKIVDRLDFSRENFLKAARR